MRTPYLFYRIADACSRRFPIRAAYRIASAIACGIYLFSWKERKAVRENLAAVSGKRKGRRIGRNEVLRVYENFSRYCVDVLYSGRRNGAVNKIEFVGASVLDEALSGGKGVVMLSAHLGNWELGAMALATRYPISVIVNVHKDPRVNRFFERRRAAAAVRSIPLGGAFQECLKVLAAGGLVGVNGDRLYSGAGVETVFFGKSTRLPSGPAFLSLRSGAPIVAGCLVPKKETGGYEMRFYESVFPGPFSPEAYQRRCVAMLERMIGDHPTQWFAFAPVWARPGANGAGRQDDRQPFSIHG